MALEQQPAFHVADIAALEVLRGTAPVLDALPRAIVATDTKGIVVGWNRVAERLYDFCVGKGSSQIRLLLHWLRCQDLLDFCVLRQALGESCSGYTHISPFQISKRVASIGSTNLYPPDVLLTCG